MEELVGGRGLKSGGPNGGVVGVELVGCRRCSVGGWRAGFGDIRFVNVNQDWRKYAPL